MKPATHWRSLRRIVDVPAPAKINLFLHITGRREDGYHLLQSVFMLLDWCDTLHFERRSDGQLSREDLGGPPLPADDLCLRAARALQQATGCAWGAHIQLEKRLPAQAGMGGGSSDAATCLLALNRLWGLGLKRQQLQSIGLKLGADVPFFLCGHHAWVEGIGERITPVLLPAAGFVIVKPPGGASTRHIFTAPDLKRDTETAIISGFAANSEQALPVLDLQKLLSIGHNDLQPVAQNLCPDVVKGIDWLARQGLQGRMTGSGTAVFAPMPQSQALLPTPTGWTVRECKNMDAHPLIDWSSD